MYDFWHEVRNPKVRSNTVLAKVKAKAKVKAQLQVRILHLTDPLHHG